MGEKTKCRTRIEFLLSNTTRSFSHDSASRASVCAEQVVKSFGDSGEKSWQFCYCAVVCSVYEYNEIVLSLYRLGRIVCEKLEFEFFLT